MNVEIDRDGCIACELCVNTCPEVFRMADDGYAEAYAEVTKDNEEAAKDAESGCPVSVIHVEE